MKTASMKYIFLSLLFLACSSKLKNEAVDESKNDLLVEKSKTPDNVDDDFKIFLSYFNKDSIFQISRIRFPVPYKELELSDSSDLVNKIYEKKNHHHFDFSLQKSEKTIEQYKEEMRINKNEAVIEVRGIDNGFIMDYFFQKINGRWMLITWIDSST